MKADPYSLTRLARSERLLVLTGAGVSAESGIPTFRGAGGLWREHRAEELATPEAFARDPELVWEWYQWRRGICNGADPNAAHRVIAALEGRVPSFLLATQNVDGLHQRAGSRQLIALHGNIDDARCTACRHVFPLEPAPPLLPPCPACGAMARPHILWFGEQYWPGTLETAWAFASQADAVLVVGTSGAVGPPAYLALEAKRRGAFCVEVNPQASALSEAMDLHLQQGAVEALGRIAEAFGIDAE
jgi:NAD-dependent deacetylase